jgi:uncharacterized protein YdeI (BOF family)
MTGLSLLALLGALASQLPTFGLAHLVRDTIMPAPVAAQQAAPTIGEIVANPDLHFERIYTLTGQVVRYVDENEFLLSDGTGEIQVDPGPPWYQRVEVTVGSTVTITGQIDRMRGGGVDLDACRIVAPDRSIDIRDCSFQGPPPWAGGPNRRGGGQPGGPPAR